MHFTFHNFTLERMWLSVIAFVLQFVKWSVKRGVNSGLTLIVIVIVIVIVIGCHLLPFFFLKSGTLIFDFFGIIITCLERN